jgi:cellulose synthase/poly-beta-1,6-N-acetylglucosamine synthase-like glycosyltransferase
LGGCGGISLFEGQEAAYAVRHAAAEHFSSTDRDGVFERRLAEARAFGEACDGLAARSPELSAKSGLTLGQRAVGFALIGTLTSSLVLRPEALNEASVAILAGVFSLIILLRLCATIAASPARKVPVVSRIPDNQLEVLTVLVPLYREGPDVVAALIAALSKLDYPSDKLDVKLLLEADDEDTVLAVRQANVPTHFELIPVPPGAPRTKPKALNYGLASARGEIVAVFDAEDRPSPEQPREAVAAFHSGPRDLSVVQAPLLIHNGAEGWLPRQFEIEYGIHFRVWLPFLARLHLPLPLGGTSNYFRRSRLKAAGGWDAWNVTEDADLGLRLARFGGRAAMISSPTWEEAPVRFRDWLAQRTRWTKGHLQTWLVLMRQPLKASKDMGWGNFASVQLTLGGSLLASIMHAPIVIWMLLGLFTPWVSLEGWHAALFSVGYGGVIAAALATRLKPTVKMLVSLPLYWPLLSLAMICALWEIGRRPHFWAKTPHGVKSRKPRLRLVR